MIIYLKKLSDNLVSIFTANIISKRFKKQNVKVEKGTSIESEKEMQWVNTINHWDDSKEVNLTPVEILSASVKQSEIIFKKYGKSVNTEDREVLLNDITFQENAAKMLDVIIKRNDGDRDIAEKQKNKFMDKWGRLLTCLGHNHNN